MRSGEHALWDAALAEVAALSTNVIDPMMVLRSHLRVVAHRLAERRVPFTWGGRA